MVKVNKYLVFLFLIILVSPSLFAQQKKIELKKGELSEIKQEIRKLENDYKLKSKKEKKSFSSYQNFSKQKFLLNKLINKLKRERIKKNGQIRATKKKLNKVVKEIEQLKKNYSKYIVSIYKFGQPNEWEIFFNFKSLQNLFLRYKYLREFSKRRKIDLEKLKSNELLLVRLKNKLEKGKREKDKLTRQKKLEEKNLINKVTKSNKILLALRKDKIELRKEISAKKNAKRKISNLIARLIKNEKKSKNNNSNKDDDYYNVNLSTKNFSSFAALKGRMRLPVKRGRIVRKFGKNRNKKLNTVTVNYGVDIKVTSDKAVNVVAQGVVSAIDWIPGYGSVIIVSHKGNYRTVYSHLDDIFVNEGDRLAGGSNIGRVGESLSGYILHFEIWNSRKNQNPERWFAHR